MTTAVTDETEAGADHDGVDLEKVTELAAFEPERMDGVSGPANGFAPLMIKSIITTTEADEMPAATNPEGHITAVMTEPASPDTAVEADASPPAPVTKASEDTVTVEIPKGASISISPADLAKLNTLKRQLVLEQHDGEAVKRDMDPNVGGGVDRDKIPAEDFAGPNRTFPIVTPGDVADIAPNLNHTKYDPEPIKRKAMAIARRKGPKFEAQLPDSWTSGDAKKAKSQQCPDCNTFNDPDAETCSNCGHDLSEPAHTHEDTAKAKKPKKGKPFPGAAPAFGGKNDDSDEDDSKAGDAKKGVKDCPECGKTYHADSKQRTCENCGHDLPTADHAAKGMACKGCGNSMAKGDKFCSACGIPAGKAKAKKAKQPFPADAKVDAAIDRLKDDADAALAAQHADPDAESHPADHAVTQALENVKDDVETAAAAQAKDEETDTATQHAAKSAANDGPAYHLARLHDATCAAYHHHDVIAAHPLVAKGLAELADPAPFAAMVTAALTDDAGTGSRMAELPSLSAAYHAAVAMKAAAAHDGLLDAAMDDLRKAFTDYYPDAHPKPGAITPGAFHRPYITTGRANETAKPGQKPRVPLASHVPNPDDFHRPLITAGREAASPGSKPSGVGKARMYYSNDGKGQAATVLAAMHDWIAGNHPTICPMKGAPYDNEPGVDVNSMASTLTSAQPMPKRMTATQATSSPVPVGAGHAASVVTPGPTRKAEKAAAKEERKMAKAARIAQEAAAAAIAAHTPAIDPELLKSTLRGILAEELGDLKTTLGEHEQRIAEWESAPDPAQMTPRNGAAALGKAREAGQEVPAGGDGPSEQRLMRLMKQTLDPDGGVRVAAIGELTGLLGREKAAELLAAAH